MSSEAETRPGLGVPCRGQCRGTTNSDTRVPRRKERSDHEEFPSLPGTKWTRPARRVGPTCTGTRSRRGDVTYSPTLLGLLERFQPTLDE